MSIFTKPLSELATADVQELLQDGAVESVRLEFKSKTPDKDETLKKLSSFANSFGGFMVIGAKANSADGRIEDLPGVDEQPGYKQKVVQWCFDAVSPPLIVQVSDPIPATSDSGRSCYVIYTAESDVAPHFLNGRKGIWVRTDEFSQRYEPQLATENEIRHLLDRRVLIQQRRIELVSRSRNRFERFVQKQSKGPLDAAARQQKARLEVSVGPRFPAQPVCTQTALVDAFKKCRIDWRQVGFPRDAAIFVSQHESVLKLSPGETEMMIEATIWGALFYGTGLVIERGPKENPISGVHLYSLIGHLLVFAKHANRMLCGWGYQGALSIDVALSGVLDVPWIYTEYGMPCQGPHSELDGAFSFSLPTTTEELQQRPDGVVMSLLRYILFGMNWADPASNPAVLEALLCDGYKYNSWEPPSTLRL